MNNKWIVRMIGLLMLLAFMVVFAQMQRTLMTMKKQREALHQKR
jgi:hypothetical protein